MPPNLPLNLINNLSKVLFDLLNSTYRDLLNLFRSTHLAVHSLLNSIYLVHLDHTGTFRNSRKLVLLLLPLNMTIQVKQPL
jgi:hypothetical protein